MNVQIDKDIILDAIKDDLLEYLSEDFFTCLEENRSEYATELYKSITDYIINKIETDEQFKDTLISNICTNFIENIEFEELQRQIADRLYKKFIKSYSIKIEGVKRD